MLRRLLLPPASPERLSWNDLDQESIELFFDLFQLRQTRLKMSRLLELPDGLLLPGEPGAEDYPWKP